VFLTTAGANSNVPAVMSYQANNIRGQWKRAFCSATLVGMGGVGGIAGGLIFRYVSLELFALAVHVLTSSRFQDKPGYRPGLYACIACCLLTLIIVALITLGSWRSNKKADRGEVELEYHDVRSLSIIECL
jgi:MFS family permease